MRSAFAQRCSFAYLESGIPFSIASTTNSTFLWPSVSPELKHSSTAVAIYSHLHDLTAPVIRIHDKMRVLNFHNNADETLLMMSYFPVHPAISIGGDVGHRMGRTLSKREVEWTELLIPPPIFSKHRRHQTRFLGSKYLTMRWRSELRPGHRWGTYYSAPQTPPDRLREHTSKWEGSAGPFASCFSCFVCRN